MVASRSSRLQRAARSGRQACEGYRPDTNRSKRGPVGGGVYAGHKHAAPLNNDVGRKIRTLPHAPGAGNNSAVRRSRRHITCANTAGAITSTTTICQPWSVRSGRRPGHRSQHRRRVRLELCRQRPVGVTGSQPGHHHEPGTGPLLPPATKAQFLDPAPPTSAVLVSGESFSPTFPPPAELNKVATSGAEVTITATPSNPAPGTDIQRIPEPNTRSARDEPVHVSEAMPYTARYSPPTVSALPTTGAPLGSYSVAGRRPPRSARGPVAAIVDRLVARCGKPCSQLARVLLVIGAAQPTGLYSLVRHHRRCAAARYWRTTKASRAPPSGRPYCHRAVRRLAH